MAPAVDAISTAKDLVDQRKKPLPLDRSEPEAEGAKIKSIRSRIVSKLPKLNTMRYCPSGRRERPADQREANANKVVMYVYIYRAELYI